METVTVENARLIAATPELLAACKAVTEFLAENVWECGQPHTAATNLDDMCRLAILNAEGEI